MFAWPALSRACKILNRQEVKPHKVRYYLERRDAEFEQKAAQVLCVYRNVKLLKETAAASKQKPSEALAIISYDEARHPSDRNDGAGLAAQAGRAPELRARF
jgi:hypothetical protein